MAVVNGGGHGGVKNSIHPGLRWAVSSMFGSSIFGGFHAAIPLSIGHAGTVIKLRHSRSDMNKTTQNPLEVAMIVVNYTVTYMCVFKKQYNSQVPDTTTTP